MPNIRLTALVVACVGALLAFAWDGRALLAAPQAASEARRMLPEYWDIWWMSGVVALEQNKLDEAQAFFEKSDQMSGDLKILAWMHELALRRAASSQPAK